MSKLFMLKKWMTLDEAANYLSGALQEPVTIADILRLGVDGHMPISVHFVNGASATLGKAIGFDEARFVVVGNVLRDGPLGPSGFPREASRAEQDEWMKMHREISDSEGYCLALRGDRISEHQVVEWEGDITSIRGIWDIPTISGSSLDVEHRLQALMGGPEITLTCLDGAFVVTPDGVRWARIMMHMSDNEYCKDGKDKKKYPYGDRNSYHPAGGLPEDAPMVVRTSALTAFLSSLESANEKNTAVLDKRERTTLLAIIGALAEHANIDLGKHHKAGETIAAMLDAKGVRLSARTIGEHLKAVREATESRM